MAQTNESAVRDLLERWAAAVRAKNMSEVLANHSLDFRMFDVPPPFESGRLAAYEDTWRLFYSSQPEPVPFAIKWLEVVAGDDVAFALRICSAQSRPRRCSRRLWTFD
jgi:ketosteroid isomerase-like protein